MLGRHMFGYAPSLLVSGLVSFASVSFFTSWMSQSEYGQYSLAINTMTMLIGVCFFWLQSASTRLMPQAVERGSQLKLYTTLYCMFTGCGIALLVVSALLLTCIHLGDWRVAVWFAAPLSILRALLNLNQSIHRNFVRIKRYNMIEIGQSVVGLSSASILIVFFHAGAGGAALGTVLGFAAMSLFDWRILASLRLKNFDRLTLIEIANYGAPFVVTFGLSFILSGSDRFLIEYFLGSDQVGIYSAGYAIPDRIGQNIFMAVATASFPLLVRRLDTEGVQAAREQTYTNGVALLALSVPACAGMLMSIRQITAVLIGHDFQAGAITVMPWITVATILNGIAAHYFDHAFHLAKRTRLFFYTLGPAAIVNFLGNLYTIPKFGIVGAAWTTLAAYALYLTLSILIGRKVFRIHFPLIPALQIFVSTAAMAAVLSLFHFPENAFGLVAMVVLGASIYSLGLLAFDIMGTRKFVLSRLHLRSSRRARESEYTFTVLTTFAKVEVVAREWEDLFKQSAQSIFGSYRWFEIWWSTLGRTGKDKPLVFVARNVSGELVGVLPLARRSVGVLTILEWAGQDVFDYTDILASDDAAASALWEFALSYADFDIALIKDANVNSWSLLILRRVTVERQVRKNYFLSLEFPSGEAWTAAQSRKLRGDIRRKMEKMEARGPVYFHIYENGNKLPTDVIDALYRQKLAWFLERHAEGVFARDEVQSFLLTLAGELASQRQLYLAWLSCGDAIVACHMGFVRGSVLYLYHTTYDADFAVFSPGMVIMSETIKAAVDAGMSELDFMRGDEAYKQRFASGSRPLSTFLFGRTWLGKASIRLSSLRTRRLRSQRVPDEARES